jgi:hypothetical protein
VGRRHLFDTGGEGFDRDDALIMPKRLREGKVQCEYEIHGTKGRVRQCPNPALFLVKFWTHNDHKVLVAKREARCYWHCERAKFFPDESLTPSIISTPPANWGKLSPR